MSVEKIGNKYRAKIHYMGHQTHIGMFDTRKQAEQAVEDIKHDIAKHNFLSMTEGVEGTGKVSLWERVRLWLRK
jgi:hypothetical protein